MTASRDQTSPSRPSGWSERGTLAQRVSVVSAALGGVVGTISAMLTMFFIVRPNLAPSTDNRAEITTVALEPNVTLEEYFSHFDVKSALKELKTSYPDRTQILLDQERPRLKNVGTVVHFGLEVAGLRGIPVGGRWTVFDADTGKRLGESELLDPLPLSFKIEKKDSDTGAWESWIDTSSLPARHLFVRLELFDERRNSRMVFKDTPVFTVPSG